MHRSKITASSTITASRSPIGQVLAAALAPVLMSAAIAFHALDLPVDPSHEGRPEMTRGFQSLTAGGPFNPIAASAFKP